MSRVAIVGHQNMDFDCLASMVAAGRLHPEAELFLQPTSEGPVREYLNLYREHFDFKRLKQFDESDLETLVVVECSSRERLGPYSDAVDAAEQIVLYDHHLVDDLDFDPDVVHDDEAGALITSMVERLRDAGHELTEEEATLYLLALHQETGSFQFGSTTGRDYGVGQFLMDHGANLDVVQEYTHRPLSAAQIDLMNDLLENSQSLLINEVTVTLATAGRDEYIPEIALLAHKLQDTENANFLVVIVALDDRIQIVFRNRHEHLDVGEMARILGGGGHPRAASASMKNRTTAEAEDRVLDVLNEHLSARRTARDIMSTPVHSIRPTLTVDEAHDLMLRLGHHGLPITTPEKKLVGIVTRTDVDKAMNHDLGHAPVKGVMSPDVVTVKPDAGLERLRNLLTNEQIGRVPVIEAGHLIGIVTRTDLIRAFHHGDEVRELGVDVTESDLQSSPDVSDQLEEVLEGEWLDRIESWGNHADRIGDTLYLVGGCVRDVLLDRPVQDLDFLLEEDAVEFTTSLFGDTDAEVSVHDKFQTAVVTLNSGEKIDFATARSEYYSHPSALPEVDVEHASIVQDLRRRDFTINAMAINLTPGSRGRLIDLYGGYRDLRNGVIRILYAMSFVDDPTRIFRAVRFARRLGFDVEQRTREQLESAVDEAAFDEVSGERLRYELELIFREEDAWSILSELADLGVLGHVHSALTVPDGLEEWLARARELTGAYEADDPELVFYCLLFESLTPEQVHEVTERLNVPRKYRAVLEQNAEFEDVRRGLQKARSPSDVYRVCERVEDRELLLARMAIETGEIEETIRMYLDDLAHREPLVDGDLLEEWGVEPGPGMGDLLGDLFDYQLDHDVNDRKELREAFADRITEITGLELGESSP